jgi:DNA-directed RNA polymerase subunit RPC12/RpoP
MSSSDKINGILVESKKLEEEKCGKCKNHLILKTFLDLSNKQRILAIACENCSYQMKIKSLEEYEKFSIKRSKNPQQPGWKY